MIINYLPLSSVLPPRVIYSRKTGIDRSERESKRQRATRDSFLQFTGCASYSQFQTQRRANSASAAQTLPRSHEFSMIRIRTVPTRCPVFITTPFIRNYSSCACYSPTRLALLLVTDVVQFPDDEHAFSRRKSAILARLKR